MTIYSIEEVASILKIGKRALYQYIKSGELVASKIGKSWRITEANLTAFVESCSTK